MLQNQVEPMGILRKIHGELVRVPTEEKISVICIQAAEHPIGQGVGDFMGKRMACKVAWLLSILN